MFITTMKTTAATTVRTHVPELLLDDDIEICALRMLARSGDPPEREAQLALGAAEQRAARRRARLLTPGATGRATTFELEAWHTDPRTRQVLERVAHLRP